MMLARFRRRGAPAAVLTLVAFWATNVAAPLTAAAQEAPRNVRTNVDDVPARPVERPPPGISRSNDGDAAAPAGAGGPASSPAPAAAPLGGDKTGVSSQAIALPQGSGKIQGMGESFSMQLSTGAATFSVPFSLPKARGAVQPSLALTYSSSSGHAVAGVGWDLGVPSISRQTDRGIPRYESDPSRPNRVLPDGDWFVFNGGQELVPICLVVGGSCEGLPAGEQLPSWANGWMYFRPRVEGGYLRFFLSVDARTWRVQSKSGESMELGVPLDGSNDAGALEVDPTNPSHIFRWNLARQYDAQGAPNASPPAPTNVVVYKYLSDAGMAYLADVYDTPPAAGNIASLPDYAHHVHLTYEGRPDATFSYRRGWRVDQRLRLTAVDVASKTFDAPSGPRHAVRRYHLAYDGGSHASLLASVAAEGRCGNTEADGTAEVNGTLPTTSCPSPNLLPPMTFGYQHVTPYTNDGSPGAADLAGYEGFDERVHALANSPPHSLDEELTDLFDVNADGLPDVVVTAPALYGGAHGLYLNGAGGKADTFGAALSMCVSGVPGEDTNIIKLSNTNLSVHDIDGDGIVNLLHMPLVKTYSVYTPQPGSGACAYTWQGRAITSASQQSPKIDFTRDASVIRVMDVDGDGLVDVVHSSGTQYETFFALGRYSGGDGQYGHAARTRHDATISTDPVTSCLPWSAEPVLLSDPDVRIADMNGDGLPDIVRLRPGDVRYWPGRGNGFWGTGDRTTCPANTFGQNRHIAMTTSPEFGIADGSDLLLDDVNGDGLDDLVKVRFDAVDIYLNVDGNGWTGRHVLLNTPAHPSSTHRVRLVDINGSGTRDLLWGDAYAYKYIDLTGGVQPWVLTHVANGLGKTTDLDYTTSTTMMLAAEANRQPWTSKAPMPIHVVQRVTDRDNLQLAGRAPGAYVTEYSYANAVYDGRQREFRGFRAATTRKLGDANSPTSKTTSTFLLGECRDDSPDPSLPSPCDPAGRWRDNPREALKGLPLVVETFDEMGVHVATEHHTYRLRQLYQGMDDRVVRVAFESASDSWRYDTAPFTYAPGPMSATDVELESTLGEVSVDTVGGFSMWSSAGRAHIRSSANVDPFGNATDHTAYGCVDGCGAADEAITTSTIPGRVPGDTSGWLWRTVEQYVTGSQTSGRRKDTTFTYDGAGNLLKTAAVLAGTLPLDRFHEDPSKAVAPPPPNASADGTIQLDTRIYDNFGNVTEEHGPNHRCRLVAYTKDYADLPSGETVLAGPALGDCGSIPLMASALYDRGLQAPVKVIDLHGEVTLVGYDGFGRLKQLTKPSASQVGSPSALPSVLVDYTLPLNPSATPYSVLHTQAQNGATESDGSYQSTWAYVDGLGRTIVTLSQADPSAGDGGAWIVTGLADYDAKGAARRAYRPWFWSGDPAHFPLSTVPPTSYGSQRYDAFGRQVQTFGLDGAVTLQSAYHALGVDRWDAADLAPGPHQGTYASALADGHGRAVLQAERVHRGGAMELHLTRTSYLPTGEPVAITRTRVAGIMDAPVTRWMRYDSLGRMVLNVEPDTTKGFNPSLSTDPSAMKAWRYAYDDSGDLVGTSDARGCGSNFFFDAAGRISAEDYSPCQSTQDDYSPPDVVAKTGVEVLYHYDSADSPAAIDDCSINGALLMGRLASVSDRGQKVVTSFDGRGRATCIAKQIAKPGSDVAIANRYAPRWYTQTAQYDAADRPVQQSTGAKVAELLGAGAKSFVTTSYTQRGTVKRVSSSYGDLVVAITRDADGAVEQVQYGDVAGTTTAFSYDQRRRLSSVQTYRGPPAIWTAQPSPYSPAPSWGGAPTTLQLLLEDTDYVYDAVDNPTEIRDWRTPSEWPAGAKPVTRKMQYDDLYRLTRIDYTYSSGDDPWSDTFASEDQGDTDTRRAKPSPHVAFDKRVLWQTFQYDWLGNTVATDDDTKGFYDRSLGTIVNGTAATGPYQLKTAGGIGGARGGSLSAMYDDAGNLISLAVARSGPCVPAGSVCGQRFVYDWDEVGRLARARRWDTSTPMAAIDPSVAPAASLAYAYDAYDSRVLKAAYDAQGNAVYTVYALPSLELRRAAFDGTDYTDDATTEVPYLQAHGVRLARLHYAESDVPALASGRLHVLLKLTNHLGSNESVIDRDTSELVERSTYQAYGAAESDYRPERWGAYREDYRFTGKEEDVEVGLQYFGKRFYAPMLGRWVAADPLAVHALGADNNVYAYVTGKVLRAVDPVGLQDVPAKGSGPALLDASSIDVQAPAAPPGPYSQNPAGHIDVGTIPITADLSHARPLASESADAPEVKLDGGAVTFVKTAVAYETHVAVSIANVPSAIDNLRRALFAPVLQRIFGNADLGEQAIRDSSAMEGGGLFNEAAAFADWVGARSLSTASQEARLFRRATNAGPFAGLKVPMQMRWVKYWAARGGVGLKGIKVQIDRNPENLRLPILGHTESPGKFTLYPAAFTDAETLVKTLGHERTHCAQFKLYGKPTGIDDGGLNETAAYAVENQFWEYLLNHE